MLLRDYIITLYYMIIFARYYTLLNWLVDLQCEIIAHGELQPDATTRSQWIIYQISIFRLVDTFYY